MCYIQIFDVDTRFVFRSRVWNVYRINIHTKYHQFLVQIFFFIAFMNFCLTMEKMWLLNSIKDSTMFVILHAVNVFFLFLFIYSCRSYNNILFCTLVVVVISIVVTYNEIESFLCCPPKENTHSEPPHSAIDANKSVVEVLFCEFLDYLYWLTYSHILMCFTFIIIII